MHRDSIKALRLLDSWKLQIRDNERKHSYRSGFLKKVYYVVNVLGIVIEGVVATALFTNLETLTPFTIMLTVAILETFALILNGASTFLDFGSASNEHFNSSKEYDSLLRFIDTIETTFDPDDDPSEILESIRKQYDDVYKNAPYIHDHHDHQALPIHWSPGNVISNVNVGVNREPEDLETTLESVVVETLSDASIDTESEDLSIGLVDNDGVPIGTLNIIPDPEHTPRPRNNSVVLSPSKMCKVREAMMQHRADVQTSRKPTGALNLLRYEMQRMNSAND